MQYSKTALGNVFVSWARSTPEVFPSSVRALGPDAFRLDVGALVGSLSPAVVGAFVLPEASRRVVDPFSRPVVRSARPVSFVVEAPGPSIGSALADACEVLSDLEALGK